MKCRCCGNVLEAGLAKCNVCEMTAFEILDNNPAMEEMANQLAEKIREQKLTTVWVEAAAYRNSSLDAPNAAQKEQIRLAQSQDFAGREIVWFPEEFARVSGSCQLSLRVCNIKGQVSDCQAIVQNPQIEGFWKIGILPLDGFAFRAVIGTPGRYTQSEPIPYY